MSDTVQCPASGAGPTRWAWRSPKGRFILFMIALTALYAAGLNSYWRFQRDSVLYMGLGRSLAETGTYSFNYRPHIFVWPGFPAMLSLVYMTLGESFLAMNALISVFGLGAVAVACLLFREVRLSERETVACALMYGLSRTLYYYSSHIMPDVPFSFFVLVGLYCGVRMVRTAGRASWLWTVGAAASGAAALFVRPLGPALLIALGAGLWLRRGALRQWTWNLGRTALIAAPVALAGGLWLLRCAQVRGPHDSGYFYRFVAAGPVVRTVVRMVSSVPALVESLPDALLGVDLGMAVGLLLALVAAVGFLGGVRRGESLLCSYGLVYLGAVCLGSPGRRYLLPALPVLIVWLVRGAATIGGRLGRLWQPLSGRRLALAGRVLLGLALAVNTVRIGKVVYQARSPRFYEVTEGRTLLDYFALAEWLRDNARPDDLVLAYESRFLHYFTYPRCVRTLDSEWMQRLRGTREAADALKQMGVTLYVSDPGKQQREGPLRRLVKSSPEAFRPVGQFGSLALVRVRARNLRTGDP